MIKKIIPVIFYILICSVVSLIFPHSAESTYYVDSTFCMTCHDHGQFGSGSKHDDCNSCHYGSDVKSENCSECHPIDKDPDACNLINFHDPGKGTDCLRCHTNHCGEDTTHIENCFVSACHVRDALHELLGHNSWHNSCTKCHEATDYGGVIKFHVETDKCIVCHPVENPGKNSLVNFHDPDKPDANCQECHTEATREARTTTGHTGACLLECHNADDIHAYKAHKDGDCTQCHDGSPQAGNVEAGQCVVCHPTGNPGKCNLSNHHGATCLKCHAKCTDDTTTTTTANQLSGHTDICLECHLVGGLHEKDGHDDDDDCTQCHDGEAEAGNVGADKCAVCHPADDPGKCSLVEFHSESCRKCHTGCMEDVTTTTTVGQPQPSSHFEGCLECHYADDIHVYKAHQDCKRCHDGSTQAGNVGADKCIVCHPTSDPGKCKLANYHGATCQQCHTVCVGGGTAEEITTEQEHIDVCLVCHFVTDLHNKGGHNDCTQCHYAKAEAENVGVGKCAVCHPMEDPGKCNLANANYHGTSCVECHFNCVEDATTTTVVPTPDTTTTTTTARCPSKKIYGEDSEETELLRCIRDDILSKTPEGRELIRLYYEWSPVIVKAIEEEEEFKEEVKGMIDEILLLIEKEAK